MKTLITGFLAIATFFFTSCKENKSNLETVMQHGMTGMHSDQEISITKAGQSKVDFTTLYSHYFQLTSALAKDLSKDAGVSAKGIVEALAIMNKETLTEPQKKQYAAIEANIKKHAEHIAGKTGNIEHQREYLDLLSTDVYNLTKALGTQRPIFKVFCPMYNNNKGAYWLSDVKEVNNPYYGKEMLSCGEIKEEIK